MAEMGEGGGGGHGKGKKRAKKSSTRVDMTPMVDLAFLLLTFFVLTATFSKPKVMSLVYPAKPDPLDLTTPPKINNAITFLLSEDKIYYYTGQYRSVPGEGKPATTLEEAKAGFGPQGVRKLLADLNKSVLIGKKGLDKDLEIDKIQDSTYLRKLIELKQHRDALKVLIKTDDKATCKNFIDLIDELKIAEIGVIAPVDILASELELLKAKTK